VRGPERCGCCFAACRAPSTVRAPVRGSATGLQRAREGMPYTSRRAGTVQMRGAFAVFGQVVVITWGSAATKSGSQESGPRCSVALHPIIQK